jgi:outer membrane receptor protein involved in Fe transport
MPHKEVKGGDIFPNRYITFKPLWRVLKLNRKILFSVALVLGLAFIFPQAVLPGTVGKISGKVVNEETKESLPGVAVSIVGTKIGALTNENGEYFILNVPVGTYTLRAALIGFAPIEFTNLSVSVDLTTYADFALSKKALELGKTITVRAERPLIIKDQTASIKLIESEQIKNMPTRGYQDIVGIQAGVVAYRDNPSTRARGARENTNTVELNIRGGRSSEVAYYVDGFSQQDPLSGISTTNINNNALSEVEITTGGFSAEYGWVASGVINATTREGTDKYTGAIEVVTDNLDNILEDNAPTSYDYNIYDANIGGPIYGLEGSTFFLSGERRWQGDRQPSGLTKSILPNNTLSGWSGQGKLSFKVSENMNLKVGGLYSIDNWQEYLHSYYFDIAHTPRYEDQNGSLYLKWTHTLSPKTFYNVSTSYFMTERIRGDGVYFKDLEKYAIADGSNPTTDATGLFWSWDDMDSVTSDANEGHVWDDFLHRKSRYIGIDGSITSQVSINHLLKAGFEFQQHNLKYYRSLFPTNPENEDYDHYGFGAYGNVMSDDDLGWRNESKNPITWALYAQDKFEWQDLVINGGLRFDYFNTRTKRVKDLTQPFDPEGLRDSYATVLDLSDLEDAQAETRLSPRLGVGFPVSDKTTVHMSYGKFFQRPELDRLYVGYDYFEKKVNEGGYYYPFGNPNLGPEKTTAYEFGVSHQMGDYTSFDITAYYKDVSNLTQVATIPAYPKSYSLYFNNDYGTIKGMDFSLNMRRIHNMTINLNYSLSWANGTGSFSNTQQNIAWTSSDRPLQMAALDFDQRHKFTGVLDLRAGRGEGPKLGKIYPLENAGVNVVVNLSSGTPYTPMKNTGDPVTLYSVSYTPVGRINSRYMGWKFRVDLKANKTLFVRGGANFDFYVWILNVFDRLNPVSVYETSGDGESTNWLNTPSGEVFQDSYSSIHDSSNLTGAQKYELKQKDPSNYDTPRQVRFGVRMSF